MPQRPDLPCADCGKLMWRGTTSLPKGQARCRPCRRLRPTSPTPYVRTDGLLCEGCCQPLLTRQARRYCSVTCANRTLNRARSTGAMAERDCPTCGRTFAPNCARQLTCSRACRKSTTRPRQQRSTRIPANHPARWFAGTCPVQYGQCSWCETTIVQRPDHRQRRYCSERCESRAARTRRRSRESATPQHQTWTWGSFMRMAAKFNWCCAYCGEKPDRLDPEHVIPLARGGKNTLANLLPTCLMCNSDKRDLTLAEWVADRRRRQLPPRTTTWAIDDSRYTHLALGTDLPLAS